MSFKSIDELVLVLERLRLVPHAQLHDIVIGLDPDQRNPDGLLKDLERRNLLTPHQAGRLAKGESDGIVLGNFKLMYRNASGSFARVFRACDIDTGEMVGMKVLRQRWGTDQSTVNQFHREAELLKKLRHKNIVPIYEVGSEGEFHYFTMEFVVGGNLLDFLKIRQKLSPAEATRYVLHMCEGLEYALRMGITHRDIKLTNVLLSTAGVAKLVDFGLAGSTGMAAKSGGETPQHALEYATLEKASGAPENDPRSDLFFIGTIYYELLTGVPPYPRTRSREERKNVLRYKNIRPIREIDPNIPRVVESIVERFLKFDPNQRYQNPSQAVADLRDAQIQLGASPESVAETIAVRGMPAAAIRALAKQAAEETAEQANAAANPDPPVPASNLATVLCVERRHKQQTMLRDYFSTRGFRVLMLADAERALERLESDPPDAILLMAESIGDKILSVHQRASQIGERTKAVSVVVLPESQAALANSFVQNKLARVLVQPSLRDVRRELYYALKYRAANGKSRKSSRDKRDA